MTRGLSTIDRGDDRGVSEVLAFSIVFGIVVTSVFLLYSVGFGSLADLRDSQQQVNSERAFELLGGNLDQIESEGAPKRSSALQLGGGSLAVGDGPQVQVEINDTATVFDGRVGSLQYDVGGTTYGYEAGARFLQTDTGGLATHEAPFQCDADADTAIVSVVTGRTRAAIRTSATPTRCTSG
jgi:hypothetical protein